MGSVVMLGVTRANASSKYTVIELLKRNSFHKMMWFMFVEYNKKKDARPIHHYYNHGAVMDETSGWNGERRQTDRQTGAASVALSSVILSGGTSTWFACFWAPCVPSCFVCSKKRRCVVMTNIDTHISLRPSGDSCQQI